MCYLNLAAFWTMLPASLLLDLIMIYFLANVDEFRDQFWLYTPSNQSLIAVCPYTNVHAQVTYSTCKLHACFYSSIRSVFWRSFYFYVTCFDMQMIMQCTCKLVYDKRQQVVLPPPDSILCFCAPCLHMSFPIILSPPKLGKFLLNLVQTQNVCVSLKRLKTDKALSWAGILVWIEAPVSVNVCVYSGQTGVHSRVYFHLTPSVPSIRNRNEWIIKKIRSSYLTSNHNSYKYSQIM